MRTPMSSPHTFTLSAGDHNGEIWEERYIQADTGWDQGVPHPVLSGLLPGLRTTGSVLIPGCGRGHDVQAWAAAGFEALGLDIAPTAVSESRHIVSSSLGRVQVADILDLSSHLRAQFDWIWEHTCLCALHPDHRESYVNSMADALKDSGNLLGVFYLNTRDSGSGPPFKLPLNQIKSLLEHRFVIETQEEPIPPHPGRTGQEILIRARKRLT